MASRTWTFRVEYIPPGTTYEGLKDSFHKDDQPAIQVESLVPAVDYGLDVGLTGTISFKPDAVFVKKPRLLMKNTIIDDKFFGFTPLYHPEGPIAADVIAITGLAGHAFASWAQPNGAMWLRDYLPKDVKNVRVLTYGYKSQLQGNEARSSLLSHSWNFIHRLREMRRVTESEKRPIIFVGHSLGCLIIKNVLIEMNGFASNMPRLPVPVIIFFGSPNMGLETAELESFVKGTPSQDLVEELRPESATLESLNDKFRHVTHKISILSCYELLGTPTAIKIAKLELGENGYYYAIKGAVLKVAGLRTTPLAVRHGDNSVNDSRRVPQKEIRGSSQKYVSRTPETSRVRRPSVNRVQEEQVNSASETYGETPNRVSFLSPDLEAPTRTEHMCRDDRDSSSEDEINVVCEQGRQNPHNVSSDPDTTTSKKFGNASGTRTGKVHLSQSNQERNANASNSSSQEALQAAVHKFGNSSCPDGDATIVPEPGRPDPSDAPSDSDKTMSYFVDNLDSLKRFLELGVDVHARDDLGWTPLHRAAYDDHPAAADLLISEGAPVEARTSKTEHTHGTPLHASTYRRNASGECTKLLLKAGADVEAVDLYGRTALLTAACNGAVNATKELIAAKANIEGENPIRRERALHVAKYYGQWQIIEVLLRKGADPLALDKDGKMPSRLGWFKGGKTECPAPSDTDKDRCKRLLRDAEIAAFRIGIGKIKINVM